MHTHREERREREHRRVPTRAAEIETGWQVIDNAYNRAHHGRLIGLVFERPPSFAQVEEVTL